MLTERTITSAFIRECCAFIYYDVLKGVGVTTSGEYEIQPKTPVRINSLPSWIERGALLLSGIWMTCLPVSRIGNNSASTAATKSRSHWTARAYIFLFFLSLGVILLLERDCRLLELRAMLRGLRLADGRNGEDCPAFPAS